MTRYDAELADVRSTPTVGERLGGFIYNDSKNRFHDGTWVNTSTVMSIEGDFIITRNTTYKLLKD
jgi:hypothetical protein